MLESVNILEDVPGNLDRPQLRSMVIREQRKDGASTQPYPSSP